MCDVKELYNNLIEDADKIKNEWKNLHNELSIIDKKKSDIEHYIEFNVLNAAQGYHMYKLLQETLQERRNIKNKIEELKPLFEYANRLYNPKERSEIINQIESIVQKNENAHEIRKYRVRVLKDLFGSTLVNKAVNS